jgi:hypothetical protein
VHLFFVFAGKAVFFLFNFALKRHGLYSSYFFQAKSECLNEADDHPYMHGLTSGKPENEV